MNAKNHDSLKQLDDLLAASNQSWLFGAGSRMQAATIKLFLPTGEATGIRTAEISNWTGKVVFYRLTKGAIGLIFKGIDGDIMGTLGT